MFGLIHAHTQITINLQPTPRRSLREGYAKRVQSPGLYNANIMQTSC